MKNLILIILIVSTSGCEKVIELDTDFKDKRLVVDASISKHRDSINGTAVIKLSETIPYFSEEINIVENAQVSVLVNDDIINLDFDNVKSYYWANVNNIKNEDYIISIKHDNNTYVSTEKLVQTPKINSVRFGDRKSLNEDEVELLVTFNDPPELGNYYLWKFGPKINGKVDYLPALDKYINGNEFTFSFFIDKTEYLKEEDYINIEINGITEDYYNYLNILTSQAGAQNGRPFSTANSVIKGNVRNQSNPENFPLGYYRVSEFDYFRLFKNDAPDGFFD